MGKRRKQSFISPQIDHLKILFCTNAFEKVSNGPAKFAKLLHAYKSSKAEIRILTEDTSGTSDNVYLLKLNIIKLFKPFGQFIRMWKYHRETIAIHKKYKYNVVVYNNALVGLFGVVLANNVYGMINDYSNASVSISRVIMKKEKLSKRLFFHYIEKLFCYLTCNQIIVNSDYLKDILSKEYDIPNNKFTVLHKGIEEELINQNRFAIIKKKLPNSILFAKTDYTLGGLFFLIEALKTFQIPIRLGVIGVTKESLSDIFQSISLYPHIDFKVYGFQPQMEVHRLMADYEVFCVPSYKEAFGVANLEALSCGCKIVSTEVGGIPEALNGAPLKWLVPPGNVSMLASAIKESLSYEITDQNLEDLNHFLIQYSDSKVIDNFLNIFFYAH